MSLKTYIDQIFADNTNYTNPGQAVNQASSLSALSSDLYTESKRFIYELLQNADDSPSENTPIKVWVKIFNEELVVAHSGRPFSTRDLHGICNVNNGTKKQDSTKTGYKGIGFKSVFGQSERVMIFTNNEYFRFDSSYLHTWAWDGTQIDWEKEHDRKFEFPWQIIPIYTLTNEVYEPIHKFLKDVNASVATIIKLKNTKETTQAIQELSQRLNMFLFLKNISEINFDVTEPISVEINREQANKITLKKNKEIESDWLINIISLTVPNEVKRILKDERNIPEKLINAESVELILASKVGNDGIVKLSKQDRLLYSYLPTDETKYSLPVLVNTSFLTTTNRESLHTDSKWNQWLFKTMAIEIFMWISKLVNTEFQFQAYQLIPEETFSNELGQKFNEGIKDALQNIPFVISRDGQLVKIEDAIIDFTFLSEKFFVGESSIKSFIDAGTISNKKFVKNTGFGSDFKKLGAASFEWKNFHAFITSTSFISNHTVDHNIELIKHLKDLCEHQKNTEITKESLRKSPFIWDHKNCLKTPTQVCFPSADDQNWNNPQSDLSFLNQTLQNWLIKEPEVRAWLEILGMTEKTDITYISQTILPQIDSFVVPRNAIQTIQELFNLYRKGDLKEDLIKQLSRIKLLTNNGSLLPAENCYLSDFYGPRLQIEETLELDIFVNKSYCLRNIEKNEWKRFFVILGVQEGISIVLNAEKKSKEELINNNFIDGYFKTEDKKFAPAFSTFTADVFKNTLTLSYIQFAESNFKFAVKFWQDFLLNYEPEAINSPAIAFWGYIGRPGRVSGDEVENYIPWYIKNIKCIPTINEEIGRASCRERVYGRV